MSDPSPASKPDPKAAVASLGRSRQILLASAVVLLVASFLPWYSFDFGIVSTSASGWHGVGVIAWLFLLVLLVLEVTRIFGVLPLDDTRANLASLGAAAVTLIFGLIFVIIRLSDGHLGFGFFLGLIALVGLGVGGFLQFKESDAQKALKDLQRKPGDTPPAAPPA